MELEFQYYYFEHLLISTIIIVRLAGLKAYLKWVSSKELIFVVMVKVTKAMIQILRHDKLSDVINLIDHLKLENIRLIGYSMAVIALDLLSTHPEYFSKAVLIATGDGLIGLPLLYLKIFYSVLQICFHMRLFQSLAKSYFCILEFFKQIGLEKNL
jgi:hypothetical protein